MACGKEKKILLKVLLRGGPDCKVKGLKINFNCRKRVLNQRAIVIKNSFVRWTTVYTVKELMDNLAKLINKEEAN